MNYSYVWLCALFLSTLGFADEPNKDRPWSIGGGFTSTSSELEKQPNKTKSAGIYLYVSYRPLKDLKLSLEYAPTDERWRSEKKCDPTSCYELNLRTQDVLLEANWIFTRFDSRYFSWLSIGGGYLHSNVQLEVEETFQTYPSAKASIKDSVHGLGMNFTIGADITQSVTLALKLSHYERQKLFNHTSRPLGFDDTSIKLECLYNF